MMTQRINNTYMQAMEPCDKLRFAPLMNMADNWSKPEEYTNETDSRQRV